MDASKKIEGIFMFSINLRNSIESLRYEGGFLHVVVAIYQQIMSGFCDTVTTGYDWSYSYGILVNFF